MNLTLRLVVAVRVLCVDSFRHVESDTSGPFQDHGEREMNRMTLNLLKAVAVGPSHPVKAHDLGSVVVVLVDTRDANRSTLVPGSNLEATNVAAGQAWHGLNSKTAFLLDYVTEEAAKFPGRLAVLIDGGDVLYGGCKPKFLIETYKSIVAASRTESGRIPSVVLGAELGAAPSWIQEDYKPLEARARHVIDASGLGSNSYTQFSDCRDMKFGPCSEPVLMQYLNSGFYMGPMHDLQLMLEEVQNFTQQSKTDNDQENAARYYFEHSDRCTLDYSGRLVLNLHNFREMRSWGRHEPQGLLAVEQGSGRDGDKVRNTVTGDIQCFVHGNGNGKITLNHLAHHLLESMFI